LTNCRPLQIRLGIRDSFDSPNAPFKTALAKLNSEVGYEFSVILPWVDVHRDLAKFFPDKTVLVPSVTSALKAYIDRIITLIDEQKFQDAFLEKMSSVYSRDIVIRVGETDQDTSCLDRNGKLTLSLPATGPEWYRTRLFRIGHDLEDVFLKSGDETTEALPATRTKTTPSPAAAIADWVEVGSVKSKASNITCLPSVNTLGKPETLFKSLLPYYVIVSGTGQNLHIESSHQPTLVLLHAYFNQHTRKNMNLTTQVFPRCELLTVGTVFECQFET
jgi:hypothetical protein